MQDLNWRWQEHQNPSRWMWHRVRFQFRLIHSRCCPVTGMQKGIREGFVNLAVVQFNLQGVYPSDHSLNGNRLMTPSP